MSLRGARSLLGGTLRATLFDRRNRYDQFNGNVPPPNSDVLVRNLSFGGTMEWSRTFQIGSYSLAYTFGGEYTRDDIKFKLSSVPETGPRSVTTLARVKDDNAALFSRIMFAVTPALTLTAAMRADYVRIPFATSSTPATTVRASIIRFYPRSASPTCSPMRFAGSRHSRAAPCAGSAGAACATPTRRARFRRRSALIRCYDP